MDSNVRRIILASGSPRRKELLEKIITNFEIMPGSFEENNAFSNPYSLVRANSQGKARNIAEKERRGIIIGADTVVAHDSKILAKPKDANDAVRMLTNISGKSVEVITGVSIIDISYKKSLYRDETTTVFMTKMSRIEIDWYVATGEPLDKAGAFAIQGKGSLFVEKINGCYHNVMGLPLYRLRCMLGELSVDFFK
ncbi:Maf family protein [Nanoarchaeota archaeon]